MSINWLFHMKLFLVIYAKKANYCKISPINCLRKHKKRVHANANSFYRYSASETVSSFVPSKASSVLSTTAIDDTTALSAILMILTP